MVTTRTASLFKHLKLPRIWTSSILKGVTKEAVITPQPQEEPELAS